MCLLFAVMAQSCARDITAEWTDFFSWCQNHIHTVQLFTLNVKEIVWTWQPLTVENNCHGNTQGLDDLQLFNVEHLIVPDQSATSAILWSGPSNAATLPHVNMNTTGALSCRQSHPAHGSAAIRQLSLSTGPYYGIHFNTTQPESAASGLPASTATMSRKKSTQVTQRTVPRL